MRVLKTILYGYVSYLNIVQHSPGSTNSSLGISSQAMAEKSCGYGRPILGSMFLIVVNVHSKWPEVLKMNRTTATHNVEILRTLFARNELAEHLINENGPTFVPEEFKSLRNKMEFVNQLHPLFTQGSAAQPSNLFKPARALL